MESRGGGTITGIEYRFWKVYGKSEDWHSEDREKNEEYYSEKQR